MHLNSNQDLYDYLVRLANELKGRGAIELSDFAANALGQAASMSTEFLGESRIALQRIIHEEKGALTASERADVGDALRQLAAALDRSPRGTG